MLNDLMRHVIKRIDSQVLSPHVSIMMITLADDARTKYSLHSTNSPWSHRHLLSHIFLAPCLAYPLHAGPNPMTPNHFPGMSMPRFAYSDYRVGFENLSGPTRKKPGHPRSLSKYSYPIYRAWNSGRSNPTRIHLQQLGCQSGWNGKWECWWWVDPREIRIQPGSFQLAGVSKHNAWCLEIVCY